MDAMHNPPGAKRGSARPDVPRLARILGRRRELDDVWTLAVEGAHNRPAPGQFNMLYVPGVGEVPISSSGDPRRDELVHTVRAVGPVTRALTRLKSGDMVGVRGPFGAGWPLERAHGKNVVLIAGGIGLAPLRPALYHFCGDPARKERLTLLYGARTPADVLYARELQRLAKRGGLEIRITVDHATGEWPGPVGVVTSLIGPGLIDPQRTLAMICGPEVMMRFTINALMDLGLSADDIYLSMERNMKCALGHCGHCQFGAKFICKDGPVLRFDRVRSLLSVREL